MGERIRLNDLETALSREINACRRNPSAYADILEKERRPHYKDNKLYYPGTNKVLNTKEGVSACNEAISFLRSASPLPDFRTAYGMTLAAQSKFYISCDN